MFIYYIFLLSLVLTAHADDSHHDDSHHDDHHEDDDHHVKREHDGMTDEEHEIGEDHHHNPDYDHEAFLGKDEADEYDKLSPEESIEKLAGVFPQVDEMVSKDGFVTVDELAKWIEGQQKRFVHSDAAKMVEHNDVDKDGFVSWDEYVKTTYTDDKENNDTKTKEQDKARDEPRFKLADKNTDGKLDKDEFGAFLHPENHEHMKPLVIKETIQDVDKNKDGFISYEEYMDDVWPESERKEAKKGSEPEWVTNARKQFHDQRDKNKDGKMDEAEVKGWVLPDVSEHIQSEAEHLIKEADVDKDGKITKDEMLEKWDVFVGSNGPTSFSDILNGEEHDEL